jgi:hypothetical protein
MHTSTDKNKSRTMTASVSGGHAVLALAVKGFNAIACKAPPLGAILSDL